MIELCRYTFLHIMPAAISCVAEKNSARLLHLSRNEIRNRALLSIQCVEKKETITLLNLAEPLVLARVGSVKRRGRLSFR